MSVKGKKILLGMTGGIACYKIPYLVRALRKAEAEVIIVMTKSATEFITPLTLETVSNNPVAVEMFAHHQYIATRHIDLAEWADLIMIAPATANCLGKIASGVSDDLLTTIICATPRQVVFAPAMNPQMWANKITQKNVKELANLGYLFIQPNEGEMACDHFGVGRMPEPDELFKFIQNYFNSPTSSKAKKKSLNGKKILITAGPTREQIDPVRFISNNSSGKMGYALAEAATQLGGDVTLISGPTSISPPDVNRLINIRTTDELYQAVKKQISKCDVLIMAAAPADFKPTAQKKQKIKKTDNSLTLDLEATPDILREITKLSTTNKPVIIGFALETENGIANAKKKLKEKNLDMIILNQTGKGRAFESDTNQVTVIRPKQQPLELSLASKHKIAEQLLAIISELL